MRDFPAVSNHAPSFPFIIVFSPHRIQEKRTIAFIHNCETWCLFNLFAAAQSAKCIFIMRRNFVQFCAKTNVTSTAHQFQFSLAFFAVHLFLLSLFCAYLWSRLEGIFACACKTSDSNVGFQSKSIVRFLLIE